MQAFLLVMAIAQAAALVALARHVRKNVKKDDGGDASRRESRLVELYGHVEELMDVFESYVEEVRQDMEKERASLTELSRQAATLYMRALEQPRSVEAAPLAAAAPYLSAVPPGRPAAPQRVPLATTNAQLSSFNSPIPAPAAPRDPAADGRLAAFPAPPADAGARVVRPAAFAPGSAEESVSDRQANAEGRSSRLSDRDREALGRFATKPQKVRFLMSRGQSLEEVARELGIGKGEVRLIAELEK